MAQKSGEAQKMPFWSIQSGNLRNAKTTPSLGEISNCPRWCTEKLKITPKYTKGVIYTNTNTYWVILKPFKHPEILKRAYIAPQKSWIGYLHVLPLCPIWKLWTYEYYQLVSSKIEFIQLSLLKTFLAPQGAEIALSKARSSSSSSLFPIKSCWESSVFISQ